MGKVGKCTNRNVLEYDIVWENILQSMRKHMTNTYDSSEGDESPDYSSISRVSKDISQV